MENKNPLNKIKNLTKYNFGKSGKKEPSDKWTNTKKKILDAKKQRIKKNCKRPDSRRLPTINFSIIAHAGCYFWELMKPLCYFFSSAESREY